LKQINIFTIEMAVPACIHKQYRTEIIKDFQILISTRIQSLEVINTSSSITCIYEYSMLKLFSYIFLLFRFFEFAGNVTTFSNINNTTNGIICSNYYIYLLYSYCYTDNEESRVIKFYNRKYATTTTATANTLSWRFTTATFINKFYW
jgi:hypothetical protein